MLPISDDVWLNLAPRPRVRSVEWIAQHVKHPNGEAIDFGRVPWARGVCEAWDDPRYREVALMWAARMIKSITASACLLCCAANDPDPALFGSSTQELVKGTIRTRLYPMIEQCRPLAGQLKPRARRNQLSIELRECRIKGAWSGSVTSMADYSCRVGWINEVDKLDTSSSGEGDPLDQMLKRFGEFWEARKIIIEGTPQEAGNSRIYRRLQAGTDCRYEVPCRKCGVYQQLGLSPADPTLTRPMSEGGGLIWDKLPDGHSDVDLARRTARYVCPHCRCEWDDEHRAEIFRRGIWVPRGQMCDARGRLQGTPARPHTEIWSSQISGLFTLDRTWGAVASEFVAATRSPAQMKAFRQLTQGWVWELRASKTTAELLGERLRVDLPAGTIPAWARFLVFASDTQERSFPWKLLAIGPYEQRHLVAHGTAERWPELLEILDRAYPHDDGGPPMAPAIGLLDSGGHHTLEVYRFCRRHTRPQRPVLACKGASNDLGGARYHDTTLAEGKARRRAGRLSAGQRLVWVAIDCWEEEIQHMLDDLRPGEPGALSLNRDAAADQDLLRQLLNGAQRESLDARGNPKLMWLKREDNVPNDFRDALRYGLAGAALYLDERKSRLPERLTGDETPGERPTTTWFATQQRR